ncbi:centrosomal protein of 70 kDa isoform X3 [Carcharodon carcharias]|uniref:centrosomal protein of 70 kDa isoform X3 n=1 Tax=Carcharodon carcharias TaxID=13397 RepID=UPI001B7E65CE|nr:centrosomal protein of 70 kDa isoform X3 [Carcharodon carcharias]
MSATSRHLTLGAGKDNLRQYEQAEWDILNKFLQQHGFKPVQLADPQTSKNQRDVIVLDKQSAVEIRKMVETLMKDTERRQALICDLIQSNKELKNDLCQQQSKTSSKEQSPSDLEQVHDAVELKIQKVKGDYFAKCCQLQKQVEQLQHNKQDMQVQLHQFKQKLHEQEKIIVRLQKKLYMVVTEEEQRIERQNKVFLQFHKQAARAHTIPNQQLRDVIDAYESQIHCLQKELSTQKNKIEDVPRERKEQLGNNRKQKYSVLDEIPEGKVLVKAYEDYLKETRSRNHHVLQKNQNLKQVLNSFSGSGCRGGNDEEFINIKVEDMDCMQEATCKRLLKNICKEVEVTDVNDLLPTVYERSRLAAAHPKLQKILNDLNSLVSSEHDPTKIYKLRQKFLPQPHAEAIPDDILVYMPLVGTIEVWAEQLIALKGCKRASLQTLKAIVSHFQILFDVSSLSGVYTRMNEVYSKLGEMSNAMRNLRQVLGLAESTPPSVLVNMIGKLCSSVNADTCRQVQQLLGTQDVDSIITKLEEHEEFFPAFHTVFQNLLQILEVDSMDHILPAVCALKLKTR